MQTRLRKSLSFVDGLGFRLVMLLSVALLPLGLISIIQTLNLTRQAQEGAELALVNRTETMAAGDRALMQGAIGTAQALGSAVLETLNDPLTCAQTMRAQVQANPMFTFAGFVQMDGSVPCASQPVDGKLSNSKNYKAFIADPQTRFLAMESGSVTGRKVLVLSIPLRQGETLLGYIALSLARDLLTVSPTWQTAVEDARTVIVAPSGEPLAAEVPLAEANMLLPEDPALLKLTGTDRQVIRGRARDGNDRVFTVIPTIPNLAYTVGSWAPASSGLNGAMATVSAVLFPLVMWLVSLAVAYFAVYRLVIRHVRQMRSQMRRFALGNRDVPPAVLTDAPAEIQDVSQTFHNLARILIRDEEALEKSIGEKTVLLKEVHHRVKNNLQLIASIISMQGRVLHDDGARQVLRSIQDRVASLASIYRNLYQAEHLVSVEADRMMGDILNQMANATVAPGSDLRITTDLQPLALLPDQAVPLSLLATEAFTNAVKYAGRPADGGAPFVNVRLMRLDDDRVELMIENSVQPGDVSDHESTGLGSQLIEAFAMQLDADSEVGLSEDGRTWRTRLAFDVDRRVELAPEDDRAAVLTSAHRKP